MLKKLYFRYGLAISLLVQLSIFDAAQAGAWLQEEGRGQVITSLRLYGTTEYFDDRGHRKSIDLFTKTELAPYFEYGLNDKLTLGGEFSIAAATNGAAEYDDSLDLKFSYGTIFARMYLDKGEKYVFSIEPGINFPATIGSDLVSDGSKPIPEIKLNFGYGYKDRRELGQFFEASTKYRERSQGELNPMLKSEITYGYRIDYYNVVMGTLSSEWTMGGVDNRYQGNYNLIKPQISWLVDPNEHVAQQMSLYTNIYGENTGAGYGFIYSLWYRF